MEESDGFAPLSRAGERFTARQSLELLGALVQRELRSRYRGSYLGWIWALAKPLVLLLVYGLVIGVFLGAAQSIPDFMLFIFVGLMAWNLFATIVSGSISSVLASGPLITKHRFPNYLVAVSVVAVAVVDLLIQSAVLLLGYAIVGSWPALQGLVFLVPSLIGLVCFALGLGLILAAVNVYVRDIGFLTDVGLQVGFWLCPIVYSYGFVVAAAESYGLSVAWVTRLYMLNPVANGVLGFQRALWPPGSTPEGAEFSFPGELGLRLFVLVLLSIGVLFVGLFVFNRLARNFAQEL